MLTILSLVVEWLFTFLRARGKSVGGSLVDEKMLDTAKRIINKARVKGVKLSLPIDVYVVVHLTESEVLGTFAIQDIPDDYMGLDIGPETLSMYNSILGNSKTILWNGPMGVFLKIDILNKELEKWQFIWLVVLAMDQKLLLVVEILLLH